jgi:biopolymer transport protein ExbD
MKIKALLTLALMFLAGTFVYAQKSKIKPKPKRDNTVSMVEMKFEPDESTIVPQIKDFAYVVEIDENSNISLTVQTSADLKFLTNTADIKPLGDFFSGTAAVSNKPAKDKFQPIVIVKADPSLNFGILTDVILRIRNSSKMRIKLEAAPAYYVLIPSEPQKTDKPRPNPLTLVVSLDSSSNVKLNMEPQGKLSDLNGLNNRLREIFKAREQNGVFRVGSNEIETTVFVKADRSVEFSDVIKLIEVIREAGAEPIGLQVDDLMPMLTIQNK